jgi:hypothetical protein
MQRGGKQQSPDFLLVVIKDLANRFALRYFPRI